MVKKMMLVGIMCAVVMAGCVSTGGESTRSTTPAASPGKTEVVVYLCTVEQDGVKDVYAIGLQKGKLEGTFSYTQDRYEGTSQMLKAMDFGEYVITGNEITFTTKTYEKKGSYEEGKITLEGREYLLPE